MGEWTSILAIINATLSPVKADVRNFVQMEYYDEEEKVCVAPSDRRQSNSLNEFRGSNINASDSLNSDQYTGACIELCPLNVQSPKSTFSKQDEIKKMPGYNYSSNGEFVEQIGDSQDVYVNGRKLDITHDQFVYISGVISKEDSSTFEAAAATTQATFNAVRLVKGETITMLDQSKFASKLLGSTYSSVRNKSSLKITDKSLKAKNARAGLIHVLTNGNDYSGGAVAWDGIDFALRGASHPKGKDGGFEISEGLWKQFINTYNWKENKGKGIKYGGNYYNETASLTFENGDFVKIATGHYSEGRVAYKASAVQGQHVFWAPNKDDDKNKGYNFKDLINKF